MAIELGARPAREALLLGRPGAGGSDVPALSGGRRCVSRGLVDTVDGRAELG